MHIKYKIVILTNIDTEGPLGKELSYSTITFERDTISNRF